MKLVSLCVKRPVFTTVMTVALLIVGWVSYNHLTLRHYPRVDLPVVSVTTQYEGASPQIVESRLTRVLESALAGIEGVQNITSISADESSRINLFFRPNYDVDVGASDVRDRIGRARSRMPEGIRDPVVKKSDADALPIVYLAFYVENDEANTAELYDYFKQHLEAEFEALPGVSGVEVYGSAGHTMRVWLDPVKMASFNITTHDVAASLRQQNVHIPAGRVRSSDREYMVTTSATLKSEEAFNDVIVSHSEQHLVRISDIGHAEFVPEPDRQTFAYFNKKPAIAVGLVKKSVANPLDVRAELEKIIPELRKALPKGHKIDVAYDQTVYVHAALSAVGRSFLEAVIFVSLVVFCFLWSWRAALIPLIAIPSSLAGTAVLLSMFGFSINTLTLLAVVLAIGLVVDDAIVVMENVHRHLEGNKRLSSKKAAISGGSEIAFAVIAMTLTLAAVYFPITLTKGHVGKFFTEFAVTLAGSVIVSGWVALTLSPMMCGLFLRRVDLDQTRQIKSGIGRYFEYAHIERYMPSWEAFLRRGLHWVNGSRKGFAFLVLVLVMGGLVLFSRMPRELVPKEDQGIIRVSTTIPQGATPNFLDRYMLVADDILSEIPEIKSRLLVVAQPNPMCWTLLHPWQERKRTSVQIINEELRNKLRTGVTGLNVYASPGSTILGSSGGDEYVQFVLQTTKSYQDLDFAAQLVESALRARKLLPYLVTDRGEDTQEFVVEVDRDKAMTMGVNVQQIAETLDTFVSGRRLTDYRKDSEQYDVIASVPQGERRTIADLGRLYVRGSQSRQWNNETMIPLEQLVDIHSHAVPLQINHHNQLRSVTLSGELAQNVSLGEAVEAFKDIAADVLPEGVRYEFAGQTKQYLESRYVLLFIFTLAIVFVYLILAAQFESFIDPLVILFTVPLSLTGAICTLSVVGGTMNIYTQVGLITLIGLITKHGILLVDFANKLCVEKNITPMQAAIEAAVLRLRPILMTTAAMVLGAMPLIMSWGAGAESRRQIGWVIVGGMLIGTFFTLFVVPLVYDMCQKFKGARDGG